VEPTVYSFGSAIFCLPKQDAHEWLGKEGVTGTIVLVRNGSSLASGAA
jgi:hypothetical protein